jgi:D-alanyl-D-alanine carboxypeptidase
MLVPVQISRNYDGMADAVAEALEMALVDDAAATALAPVAEIPPPQDDAAALEAAVLSATAADLRLAPESSALPRSRPAGLDTTPAPAPIEVPVMVADSGNGGNWSVQLGAYRNRGEAERLLLTTALQDIQAFEGADRRIDQVNIKGVEMFRARFAGLSQAAAENACARLEARSAPCETIAPGT